MHGEERKEKKKVGGRGGFYGIMWINLFLLLGIRISKSNAIERWI
jgi:hypothetical protein